jgi:hypothetical protein
MDQNRRGFLNRHFDVKDAKVKVVEKAEVNHFDIRKHLYPEKLTNIFKGPSNHFKKGFESLQNRLESIDKVEYLDEFGFT